MLINQVQTGDALTLLKTLPDASVHTIVTSPPYWNLRDYGMADQLGLERTPEEYITKMVEVFREARRVLRDDGTLWLNIGDSYAGYWGDKYSHKPFGEDRTGDETTVPNKQSLKFAKRSRPTPKSSTLQGRKANPPEVLRSHENGQTPGLKPKDLIGIPWLLAFALRADGWYLRMDIIWSKPNCMPESVTDRPTKSHEYIFLLSKSDRYYYDATAIKTPVKESSIRRLSQDVLAQNGSARVPGKTNGNMKAVGGGQNNIRQARDKQRGHPRRHDGLSDQWDSMSKEEQMSMGANKRSVWVVSPAPFKEAHFATFPQELIVDCIKAGTSAHGCCSVCGSPYKRILEPTERYQAILGKSFHDHSKPERGGMQNRGVNGQNAMRDAGIPSPEFIQKGWEVTCKCNAEIVPCIVLDPFMGAGTTAVVARKLNRNFVGFELNPAYVAIANARIYKELGAFS